jgi:hypothetical protein
MNSNNSWEPESDESQFQLLVNTVSFVANEPLLLAQYEKTAGPEEFAQLWASKEHENFDKGVNRVVEHLGGPPEFYILRDGQEVPAADNYPDAVMREVFAVFSLARKSVIRSHLFQAGTSLLVGNPDLLDMSDAPDAQATLVNQVQDAFWEHSEAAYIRLYSFWDRIGQVLDFAFFNIRKFDQNGFNSVMDRIHTNAVPMNERLKNSSSWKCLRAFQCSEKDDGLKWLLQRRNLVVHSLHLHPIPMNEESAFKSQFNHLETAHREKLRPRSPADEVTLMMGQLRKAGELFGAFLTLVDFSQSRKKDRWIRSP